MVSYKSLRATRVTHCLLLTIFNIFITINLLLSNQPFAATDLCLHACLHICNVVASQYMKSTKKEDKKIWKRRTSQQLGVAQSVSALLTINRRDTQSSTKHPVICINTTSLVGMLDLKKGRYKTLKGSYAFLSSLNYNGWENSIIFLEFYYG